MAGRDLMSKPVRTVTVKQINGLTFKGVNQAGQETMMDTQEKVGGHDSAPTPMETFLMALGGCTGMDVVSILRKMQQPVEDIRIEVKGTMQPDYPHAVTDIHIHYTIKGDLNQERAQHAIELSQNKYCSVAATLRPGVNIDYTYEIEPSASDAG
jgi:putative redox protein